MFFKKGLYSFAGLLEKPIEMKDLVLSRDGGPVPANERGWKDTVRLEDGTVISWNMKTTA